MVYQRFELRMPPAKVANPAKVGARDQESLADLAILAGRAAETRDQPGQILAGLATLAGARVEIAGSASAALSAEIAIEMERAAARLRMRGYPQDEVPSLARAIVAADLRNGKALFIPQGRSDCCHVCGRRESSDQPFIAVLSARPDHPHWLHAACWPEHVRRIDAEVEEVLERSLPF